MLHFRLSDAPYPSKDLKEIVYPMSMKSFNLSFSLLSLSIALNHFECQGQAGSLDNSFDTDGKVTTDFAGMADIGCSMAIQADGKLVVLGETWCVFNYDFGFARYNVDGSLDNTFDGDGMLIFDFGSNFHDYPHAIAIQPDGKILAAGGSFNGAETEFSLVRLNTDGTLDITFDGDGKVVTSVDVYDDYANAIAIQPDGKIVLVGASPSGSYDCFGVVRYNTDGSLDNTFDGDGKLTIGWGSSALNAKASSVAVQPDGKIVVVGFVWSWPPDIEDYAIVRFNTDGSLDNTFDGDGKLTTNFGVMNELGYAIAIQPDGKILFAGQSWLGSDGDFSVVRYNTDGSLDITFDGDGSASTSGGAPIEARSLIIQPDAKIVLSGHETNGSDYDIVVTRFNSDGSLDNTFDGDGTTTTDIGTTDEAFSTVIQPDGKIVVAGGSYNGTDFDFVLVRYLNDDVTEVNETNVYPQFGISPNPSDGLFNIHSDIPFSAVEISNALGEIIYSEIFSQDFNGNPLYQTSLDLRNQEQGIYFVRVYSPEKSITERIVLR